jgi:hypothetical protein
MPERNLDILRDLKQKVYARRKGRTVQNFAVIDASTEDPALGTKGTIVFAGTSKAEMLLFELEYRETDPKPRTRIVTLRAPLPVGSNVSGKTDLLPLLRFDANRSGQSGN